jgi:hypothetical protein
VSYYAYVFNFVQVLKIKNLELKLGYQFWAKKT